MVRKSASPHLDRLLSELAERQHGVVARRQLLAAGVASDLIERRLRSGHLRPLHRGVYAVGHRRLRREGLWLAAVLACGPHAVLSHRDAAALWNLRGSSRTNIDVTVPGIGSRRRPGIAIHRSRTLTLVDAVRTRHGIPVTDPSRTLLDLADVVSPQALERAFAQAEILRLYDRTKLEATLSANPGRRGTHAFTTALARRTARERTRGDLEIAFLGLLERHGLPQPKVNQWIDPYEADFLWPDDKVIAEVDSTKHHHTLTAFHGDREKDAFLTAAGYRVLRFTDRQIDHDEAIVATRLKAVLSPVRGFPR